MEDLEQNLAPYLPGNRDAAILDLGCGSGRVLRFLLKRGYKDVLGIDSDAAVVHQLPMALRDHVIEVPDLRHFLQNHDERFDLIVAKDVIYYFSRDDLLPHLEAMAKSLTREGYLFVEVINGSLLTGPFARYKDYRMEWTFTEHSLRSVLEAAGLSVETLFGNKLIVAGVRGRMFAVVAEGWRWALRLIYLLERGRDPQNPTIFSKKLIALARRSED